jgi:hypothetical protein
MSAVTTICSTKADGFNAVVAALMCAIACLGGRVVSNWVTSLPNDAQYSLAT